MIARALTIAGSDSGGGAGIQADLKTFTVFRVFGSSAVTALTAQNTVGVTAIAPVAPAMVRQQIDAVMSDIGCDAAKTGMLASAAIVDVVAAAVTHWRIEHLVVDPVMVAESGAALLDPDARAAMLERLVPLACVVTPNIHEAAALTGLSVSSVADMKAAARELIARGARAVLLKGGHLAGDDAVDVFDDGHQVREFRSQRVATTHTHGTGCQLSAAIAANLALGRPLDEAITIAKRFVTVAIQHGLTLGRGHGPANPMAWLDET